MVRIHLASILSQVRRVAARNETLQPALGISAAIATSRVLGYIRDQLLARYLGTSHEADAFNLAYVIPNTLRRLLAEGALTAAFVPVYTRWRNDPAQRDPWHLARVVMTNLLLILAGIVLLGEWLAPGIVSVIAPGFHTVPGKFEWTVTLIRVVFPFTLFISMAAITTAVLNVHRVFVWPATMPVFFNATIIALVLLLASRTDRPSLVFAAGVVLGGAMQWVLQWPALYRVGFRFRWQLDFRHEGLQEILRMMTPGFVSVGVAHINMAIGQLYASLLGEGAVSALYYASRIQELTIGVVAVAYYTLLLPQLSDLASRGEWTVFRHRVTEGVVWVGAWNIAAMVGLMWMAGPILHALFEYGRFDATSRDLSAAALFWYAVALPAYSLNKVLIPGFYAVREVAAPIRSAAYAMLVYAGSVSLLAPRYGVAGIAMGSAAAGWTQTAILSGFFWSRFGRLEGPQLRRGIMRILVGLGAMVGWLELAGQVWPYPFVGSLPVRFLHLLGHIGPAVFIFWGAFVGSGRWLRKKRGKTFPSPEG